MKEIVAILEYYIRCNHFNMYYEKTFVNFLIICIDSLLIAFILWFLHIILLYEESYLLSESNI